jgi:uncharacterized protein YjbI with pentapeptide repeats
MDNRIEDILTEKLEEIVSVDINNSVQDTLNEAKKIRADKIVVHDETMEDYWIISSWKLWALDPNITLKQVYSENRKIFENVRTISNKEEITKIIPELYKIPGLIVIENEKIKGFVSLVSLADFLEDLYIKPRSYLKQQAKIKGALAGVVLRGSYVGIDLRNGDLRGVDLSEADLSEANLRSADLSGAILNGANLKKAKLVRAKLTGANLIQSILTGADLRHAELWSVNLERANLEGAKLSDAVLFRANLEKAILKDADLKNAGLISANLSGADLSNANLRMANLRSAIFDEKTNLTNVELDSITIDNLSSRALKANWPPEVQKILKEKFE